MPESDQYGRTVSATLPPLLVRRLDYWVVDQMPRRTRSSVIAIAIEEFLDRQEPHEDHDRGPQTLPPPASRRCGDPLTL